MATQASHGRRSRGPIDAGAGPVPAALAAALEAVYGRFHCIEHLEQDPLRFPRRYADPRDQEVVGLLAASFAFGRVQAFLPVLERLFARLGPHPSAMLADAPESDLTALAEGFVYRFVGPAHLRATLSGLARVLREDGGLRPAFQAGFDPSGQAIEGLRRLAARIRGAAGPGDPGFLLPLGRPQDPAKRLNLYLRWMVRDDGIDLGTWPGIPKNALLVPMDVHVFRIARLLGLIPTHRSGPRLADAVALTRALAAIDPDDPVRFDFALSHLGISGTCRGTPNGEVCPGCALTGLCVHGRDADP
jgi:uncharacterized protein (TIGR02757 family)